MYAVASGKGGVGKSSVTVNLAVAMAAQGLRVGVLDADIYGHSIPRMLGAHARPTQVEDMIMPPAAHGVKVISIGMFTAGNTPVVWRGPMLHRALQQFLPTSTGATSTCCCSTCRRAPATSRSRVAQLVPRAEILVVTTPQAAAAEVAERAGTIALQTHQRIVGVVENMSGFPCPHCGERGRRLRQRRRAHGGRRALPLGRRRGAAARARCRSTRASARAATTGSRWCCPIRPLPPRQALTAVATALGRRQRGLAGLSLSISPAG